MFDFIRIDFFYGTAQFALLCREIIQLYVKSAIVYFLLAINVSKRFISKLTLIVRRHKEERYSYFASRRLRFSNFILWSLHIQTKIKLLILKVRILHTRSSLRSTGIVLNSDTLANECSSSPKNYFVTYGWRYSNKSCSQTAIKIMCI